MNIFKKIFLTLFLIFPAAYSSGQSLDEQYRYALELFNGENYYDAVTEFKRLSFFDDKNEYAFISNLLIGKCYKEGAKLNDAVHYFTLAVIKSSNDPDYFNASVELIRANILRRTTDQALKLLDQLESSGKYPDSINTINYWRGWAHIFAGDFNSAAEMFGRIDPNHQLYLLCKQTWDAEYSPSLAKILSVFIPGAGQFYTGNYVNGLVSLAWNVFAGYLTINAFAENRIFDGIVTGNLLFLRFYVGSIQNSEEFAVQNNIEIANKTLLFLQHEYKGEKP